MQRVYSALYRISSLVTFVGDLAGYTQRIRWTKEGEGLKRFNSKFGITEFLGENQSDDMRTFI